MASLKKKEKVVDLTSLIEKNKNLALIKYGSVSHIKLEEIRKKIRQEGGKIKVVKNTLLEKALKKLSRKDDNYKNLLKNKDNLVSTTAVIIMGEHWSKNLADFFKFSKDNENLSFKSGIIENQSYTAEELKKIAQLPAKEILYGKILGSLQSPVYRLHYSLKYNIQKLAYIFSERAKKQ